MALASRRARRPSIDIWPGFVDALAQLLMVIIFILLVFTAGQFLLSDALSGRDKALQELQQQLSELSDLLSLERIANEDLRASAASLSTQLKAAPRRPRRRWPPSRRRAAPRVPRSSS
jgi:chemotaxis protein MotB